MCTLPASPADGNAAADAVSASTASAERQYVPLHVHSDFSLLDGASQVTALATRAAELGVPALALTDHGVLYGAVALVRACANTGVKPVIGNEMYVVNGMPGAPPPAGGAPPRRYHLVVLAKNSTGYRNLVKLTTMAHLHGKVGKGIFARPCVNKAALYRLREGLIVSSGCLGGEVAQAILKGEIDVARDVARWFRDAFGDDYYLEIQDHGSEADVCVNKELVKIGRELGIKVIATNDSHFTSCLDAEAHDALICIQTGKVLADEKRMRYAGNEYFKSVDEMRQCFVDHLDIGDVDDALRNTLEVAEKVEVYDLFGATRIPHYPVPAEFSDDQTNYLRHIAREGLRLRLSMRQASGLATKNADDVYAKRLEFELDMIDRMGFSSYFLVVWDYIRYAREEGIPVGPGRGSAAGSLVAFALRITDVDPIPFNLLFERFLNPERKSMPDIDTDFSVEGRERVIAYVTERYGKDRVAQIITFNRLTSKAVLKDMARVHSVPYSEADKLAKMIPVIRGKPATLSQMLADDTPNMEFKKRIEGTDGHMDWIDKARRIEGANKTYGIHAAGVVISSSPLTDVVPLSIAKHGETITQYPMEDVERLGLLKMDFLGLKNLTVIESALKFINQGRRRRGIQEDIDFSVDALPLDDQKTFDLLATGELDGIFQLDASLGMRNIVRELKPTSLEDISAVLALYRPGPLDAGLIPKFIRRKHGEEPIEFDHPLLKPILEETYGVMVYQEQIMRIARDLAGYSLGQADILRRAMGKKKVKDMEKEKPRFVAGAVERGVPEKTSIKLFEMMIQFAEYCFNKSHSTAYAYLTYQTAYLKANYPVEYAAALLRSNMTNSDKLVRYLSDAKISGVKVLPPSINRSELGFTVDHASNGEAVVLFGLEAVKTVGNSVSKAVIDERLANGAYSSIIDLVERVNSRVLNKRSMGALVLCGAFDELHQNRKILSEQLDDLLNLRRKLRDRRKRRAAKELSEEDEQAELAKDAAKWEEVQLALAEESRLKSDFTMLEKLAAEKSTLGFYASGHPLYDLDDYRRVLDCTPVADIVGNLEGDADNNVPSPVVEDHTKVKHGDEVAILSVISELNIVKTARGRNMAKWMVEDQQSRMQGVVFPSAFAVCEQVRSAHAIPESPAITESGEPNSVSEVEPEAEKVVEQDARVVVWGRVDRESSGNVQLFIDDVQRVEDVEVVVATVAYDPLRNVQIHEAILRRYAGEFLDVVSSPKSMSYSYEDKSGNQITRQRRPSRVDYKTKRRKPFILRVLAEDGSVAEHSNMGNRFRFGNVSKGELSALSERTGMNFAVLNAFEVFRQHDDVTLEPSTAVPSRTEPSIIDVVEEAPEADVVEVASVTDRPLVPVNLALSSQELMSPVVEEDANTSDADISVPLTVFSKVKEEESLASIFKKFGKKKTDYPYLTDDEFESLARQSVTNREQFAGVSSAVSSKSRDAKESKTVAPVAVHRNAYVSTQRTESKAKVLAGVVNDVSVAVDEFSHSSSVTSSDSYSLSPQGGGSSDDSRNSLVFSDPPSKDDMNILYRKLASLERDVSYLTGQLDAMRRQSIVRDEYPESVLGRPDENTLSNINDSLRVTSAIVENASGFKPAHVSNKLSMSESADRIIANVAEKVVSATKTSNEDEKVMSSRKLEDQDSGWGMNGAAKVDSHVLIKNDKLSFSEVAASELDFVKMWKRKFGKYKTTVTAHRKCEAIPRDGTGRLLDLICFTAGDAVCSHYNGSFQVLLTSRFDFSRCISEFREGLSVDVDARIASVDFNCISVSVLVREHQPTTGRKVRRSLVSGVVVFSASSIVSQVPHLKARKIVFENLDERRKAMATSKKLGGILSGAKRKTRKAKSSTKSNSVAAKHKNPLQSHPSDTIVEVSSPRSLLQAESAGMIDGGQMLMWMSAAAEKCIKSNMPDVDISCMEALEMFHVPHTVRMDSDWDAVSVRAKLSHAAVGVVSIDVAAVLLKNGRPQADSGTIQAVFKISCSPFTAVPSIEVAADNWVPFDASSMAEAAPLLEQLCAEMKPN